MKKELFFFCWSDSKTKDEFTGILWVFEEEIFLEEKICSQLLVSLFMWGQIRIREESRRKRIYYQELGIHSHDEDEEWEKDLRRKAIGQKELEDPGVPGTKTRLRWIKTTKLETIGQDENHSIHGKKLWEQDWLMPNLKLRNKKEKENAHQKKDGNRNWLMGE